MSFENSGNDMVMPVAPMYGGNGGWGNGFGGDGWWVILFLFALMGNGGWGGLGGGANGMAIWPYFTAQNTDAGVQRGFDTAALTSQLAGINTNISNGFANAEVAGCNRAMDAMQSAYENQISSMNQNFANQQALQQTLFGMQSQQAQCCCENRLGLANLGADIAREACADRAAVADALKDVIAQNTAQTQRILDKMCQQELDAERRENQNLRTQLNMANLAASQTAQTSRILADNAAQTQALEQYLNPVPIPAYPVQNPNCCQNAGCGCGF
jgi:hypothetical protein